MKNLCLIATITAIVILSVITGGTLVYTIFIM